MNHHPSLKIGALVRRCPEAIASPEIITSPSVVGIRWRLKFTGLQPPPRTAGRGDFRIHPAPVRQPDGLPAMPAGLGIPNRGIGRWHGELLLQVQLPTETKSCGR